MSYLDNTGMSKILMAFKKKSQDLLKNSIADSSSVEKEISANEQKMTEIRKSIETGKKQAESLDSEIKDARVCALMYSFDDNDIAGISTAPEPRIYKLTSGETLESLAREDMVGQRFIQSPEGTLALMVLRTSPGLADETAPVNSYTMIIYGPTKLQNGVLKLATDVDIASPCPFRFRRFGPIDATKWTSNQKSAWEALENNVWLPED